MSEIRTAVYGANGRMGQIICKEIMEAHDFELVFGVDRGADKFTNDFPVFSAPNEYKGGVDLLIDFSHPSNLETILAYVTENNVATLIATTGLSDSHLALIEAAGKHIPIVYSPNTSLGISLVNSILRAYSTYFSNEFDIEIIEKHHRHKVDAPSGTAKLFASTINAALGCSHKDIGIHAVRGGGIFGEHTVLFAGEQELIEIKHTALSKSLFAQGALRLCRILVNAPRGAYTSDDLYGQTTTGR